MWMMDFDYVPVRAWYSESEPIVNYCYHCVVDVAWITREGVIFLLFCAQGI
jgi:hypothetical protein